MILYYTLPLHIRKSFTKILALEPVLPNLPSPLGPWPLPESSASWPKQPPGDMARDDQLGYVGMIIPETALVVQFHHLKNMMDFVNGKDFFVDYPWIIPYIMEKWNEKSSKAPTSHHVQNQHHQKKRAPRDKKNIVSFSGEQVLYTAAVFTAWRERKKKYDGFFSGLGGFNFSPKICRWHRR